MTSPSEHTVVLSNLLNGDIEEIFNWCTDQGMEPGCFVHFGDYYGSRPTPDYMDASFFFENVQDAMLFKLTWHSLHSTTPPNS